MNVNSNKLKIIFNIEQDEDGYPPVSFESLWAFPLNNGNYIIDNIPFFIYGIAAGDEISALNIEQEFFFDKLIRHSGSSVFRVFSKQHEKIDEIRKKFIELNCSSEYNEQFNLIAIEIKKEIDIFPLLSYLVTSQELGKLDFEEAVLHHSF